MDIDIAAYDTEGGPDTLQGKLVLAGFIYIGVCCLAVIADYKYQMRRARKRREAAERQARSRKDGEDDGNRPA